MSTCRRCTCGLGRYFVVQECGVKRKEKTGARKNIVIFQSNGKKTMLDSHLRANFRCLCTRRLKPVNETTE